jgi:hypothetical protein
VKLSGSSFGRAILVSRYRAARGIRENAYFPRKRINQANSFAELINADSA